LEVFSNTSKLLTTFKLELSKNMVYTFMVPQIWLQVTLHSVTYKTVAKNGYKKTMIRSNCNFYQSCQTRVVTWAIINDFTWLQNNIFIKR